MAKRKADQIYDITKNLTEHPNLPTETAQYDYMPDQLCKLSIDQCTQYDDGSSTTINENIVRTNVRVMFELSSANYLFSIFTDNHNNNHTDTNSYTRERSVSSVAQNAEVRSLSKLTMEYEKAIPNNYPMLFEPWYRYHQFQPHQFYPQPEQHETNEVDDNTFVICPGD